MKPLHAPARHAGRALAAGAARARPARLLVGGLLLALAGGGLGAEASANKIAAEIAADTAAAWARAQQAGVPAAAWQQALVLAREQALVQAPAQARVTVQPGLLDPRLRLAPCAQVQAVTAPGAPAHGRTRVALQCVQPDPGQRAWRVHLPVRVQVWAPAWVARAAVPAGTPLQAEHLMLAEADWSAHTTPPLNPPTDDAPWGRALVRALPAGTALRGSDLQQRQWFSNGQTVRVHVKGAGFAVVAQGLALGDGIEGRPARVRLPSGRVLTGRPVAEQAMQVTM
jgi:flagellar basal body P-ring formation protein FlgA